jgi:predicted aspartyl protease
MMHRFRLFSMSSAAIYLLIVVHLTAYAQGVARFELAEDRFPTIPVRIGDAEINLVIDTGTTQTTIDHRYREKLGRKITTKTATSPTAEIALQFFQCPEIRLGDRAVRLAEVGCYEFPPCFKGEGVDGFLGMDVLSQFCIDFDWDQRQVSLGPSIDDRVRGSAIKVGFAISVDGTPYVSVSVDGRVMSDLLLDTGYTGSISLMKPDEQLLSHLRGKRRIPVYTMSASGLESGFDARVDQLKIGGADFGSHLCTIDNTPTARRLIGLGTLRTFRAIFDFRNAKLYLLPRKTVTNDEADMSGIHLLRLDERIVVYAIDQASPAKEAGVRKGDQIIRINDVDTSRMTPADIRSWLRAGDGKRVKLAIACQGAESTIIFCLQKRL